MRLLIFLLAILISACASSSPVFHMMHSAYTEKAMAPRSSTLAWKIPWMEEPGRLQSMGLLRVGHDQVTSLSLFTFIRRIFSFSSLSVIRVVSSAYLRLLIFLPAMLIPASASSSPPFLMMYSACKLSKQDDNIQP